MNTHVYDPHVRSFALSFQCPDSATDDSQSDTDEEPAAKHRRLSPAAELSFRFGFGGDLQQPHGSQEIFQFYGDAAVQGYVSIPSLMSGEQMFALRGVREMSINWVT